MNSEYQQISWGCFKALINDCLNIKFIKIDDFFKEETVWNSLENYEDLSDLEILKCLESLKSFQGTLYVVTDASYEKNLSPFQVEACNIFNFVKNHFDMFGERFLETDILIISLKFKLAWIFHHEGIYGIVHL